MKQEYFLLLDLEFSAVVVLHAATCSGFLSVLPGKQGDAAQHEQKA